MNDQEINCAVAEACGRRYHAPTPEEVQSGSYYQYQPDFCHDLNAMHAAEETLSVRERDDYGERLSKLSRFGMTDNFAAAHAIARERAEAFLRTIGKWKDQV